MTQDKAPEWSVKAAEEVALSWFPEFHHDFQLLAQDIALALSQAYERGQESMRERAGEVAAAWGHSTQGSTLNQLASAIRSLPIEQENK